MGGGKQEESVSELNAKAKLLLGRELVDYVHDEIDYPLLTYKSDRKNPLKVLFYGRKFADKIVQKYVKNVYNKIGLDVLVNKYHFSNNGISKLEKVHVLTNDDLYIEYFKNSSTEPNKMSVKSVNHQSDYDFESNTFSHEETFKENNDYSGNYFFIVFSFTLKKDASVNNTSDWFEIF